MSLKLNMIEMLLLGYLLLGMGIIFGIPIMIGYTFSGSGDMVMLVVSVVATLLINFILSVIINKVGSMIRNSIVEKEYYYQNGSTQ